ncbi:nuclear transport factor 2 family protein [Tunturibacter empetritectus]|uniref:Nuclear transport factor 2 family protein n=1 Tax=Tunturiibacter empetritectus TaxID=3069691 RepID=A0AAU7ZC49_9BACT
MAYMQIADHLKSLEERLLDPNIRRDSNAVASQLTDDFVEFGSSGRVFDKATILEDLKAEPPHPASLLSDFKTRELAPNVVLATYKATRRNAAGELIGQSWRSSIWTLINGQWQITFHQGTPIPAAPIPTTPNPPAPQK